MPENATIWMEIIFDIAYLITVWTFVYLMFRNRNNVLAQNKTVAQLFRWMFFLLALGDTGHVGFRVVAYASGPLEKSPTLVGLGSLATAYTITIFYMILVEVWRQRFQKDRNILYWILQAVGVFRLIFMALPGNHWGQVLPPQPMGLLRNIPLMIIGISIMVLILRDARAKQDKTFLWIGFYIFLSYLFYTPVILFVNQVPMLGMLMIPKTLAYVAVAMIGYKKLY
jgi:hypothetical protein